MALNPAAAAFMAEDMKEIRKEQSMLSERGVTLLQRADALEFPPVFIAGGSVHLAGEDGWRRKLPTILPGYFDEISAQLDAHAAAHEVRERSDAREDQREADREDTMLRFDDPSDVEAQAVLARRQRAAEEAAELAKPATVEQLDKLISVAEEILAELKASGK